MQVPRLSLKRESQILAKLDQGSTAEELGADRLANCEYRANRRPQGGNRAGESWSRRCKEQRVFLEHVYSRSRVPEATARPREYNDRAEERNRQQQKIEVETSCAQLVSGISSEQQESVAVSRRSGQAEKQIQESWELRKYQQLSSDDSVWSGARAAEDPAARHTAQIEKIREAAWKANPAAGVGQNLWGQPARRAFLRENWAAPEVYQGVTMWQDRPPKRQKQVLRDN